MELKLLDEGQLAEVYHRDFPLAFPSSERKPLWQIVEELRAGEYRPWGLFDGENIVGEAFVWGHAEGFALLDYLCVPIARRNSGIGSLLIRELLEAEKDSVVFVETEVPEFASDPELAERRLVFYRRSGAFSAGYDSCVFGVPYHVYRWDGPETGEKVVSDANAACYRSAFPRRICDRYIQIPWKPSMGTPKAVPWGGEQPE